MRRIRIGYLYGNLMNLYGDRGNVLAIKKRAEWRGIETEITAFSVGDKLGLGQFDLYFFGGGQDQAQDTVSNDLMSGNGEVLKGEVERGVPLLSICGGYQLLGKYYQPKTGDKIPGVGIFDAYTVAGDKRLVGNLVVKANPDLSLSRPETLVGFENHSGKTYLENDARPLGQVQIGSGNNGEDGSEGAVFKNAIGTYLHGSLLPKNPHLADWLLKRALETSRQDDIVENLPDETELSAHYTAITRSRDQSSRRPKLIHNLIADQFSRYANK